MKRVIKMSQIKDATDLVQRATMVDGDVIITKGKYSIDAKSMMGIFSLDLTAGVTIEYPDDATAFDDFIKVFEC